MRRFSDWFSHIDWVIPLALLPVLGAGLVTINSFGVGDAVNLVNRQLLWITLSFTIFFLSSQLDMRFLRKTNVLVGLFLFGIGSLLLLFILGKTVKGATSWIDLGGFSLQPSDPMKLVLILLLAKYFSRRHIEIAHPKHIIISGLYMLIPFLLVLMQPDFGSAIILFVIWFGMILVAGISRKHLLTLVSMGLVAGVILWTFVFAPYQKARIMSFLDPSGDLQGAGYNAYQSAIAVGSGQIFGKGVGYGTQSRLAFLPEYETDFIFAAFAEEWGFLGTLLLFLCLAIVIWRIVRSSLTGATNFEILYGVGVAIFFVSHIFINVGMNIKLMPVTGITLPFLSAGGSHLMTEFLALGILMAMRRYARTAHRDDMRVPVIDYAA